MDDRSNRTSATEKVMRRVLDNLYFLSESEAPHGACGWQQVVIEPGPASDDDAAFCLLIERALHQPVTNTT